MQRLRNRRDFLAASRSVSAAGRAVTLQMRERGDDRPPRVGFTVTRKLGGAVQRNRIRRRLKEAVRLGLAERVRPGLDYVIIARPEAAVRPFSLLVGDLVDAIERLDRASTAGAQRHHRTKRPSGAAAARTTGR